MGVTLVKDANTCSAVFLPEQMRRGSFQIVVSVLEEEDFICLQEMLLATSKVVLLQHEVSLLLYFLFFLLRCTYFVGFGLSGYPC